LARLRGPTISIPQAATLILWWSFRPELSRGWKPFLAPRPIWSSCWAVAWT
jgi:hypothetical protein